MQSVTVSRQLISVPTRPDVFRTADINLVDPSGTYKLGIPLSIDRHHMPARSLRVAEAANLAYQTGFARCSSGASFFPLVDYDHNSCLTILGHIQLSSGPDGYEWMPAQREREKIDFGLVGPLPLRINGKLIGYATPAVACDQLEIIADDSTGVVESLAYPVLVNGKLEGYLPEKEEPAHEIPVLWRYTGPRNDLVQRDDGTWIKTKLLTAVKPGPSEKIPEGYEVFRDEKTGGVEGYALDQGEGLFLVHPSRPIAGNMRIERNAKGGLSLVKDSLLLSNSDDSAGSSDSNDGVDESDLVDLTDFQEYKLEQVELGDPADHRNEYTEATKARGIRLKNFDEAHKSRLKALEGHKEVQEVHEETLKEIHKAFIELKIMNGRMLAKTCCITVCVLIGCGLLAGTLYGALKKQETHTDPLEEKTNEFIKKTISYIYRCFSDAGMSSYYATELANEENVRRVAGSSYVSTLGSLHLSEAGQTADLTRIDNAQCPTVSEDYFFGFIQPEKIIEFIKHLNENFQIAMTSVPSVPSAATAIIPAPCALLMATLLLVLIELGLL